MCCSAKVSTSAEGLFARSWKLLFTGTPATGAIVHDYTFANCFE